MFKKSHFAHAVIVATTMLASIAISPPSQASEAIDQDLKNTLDQASLKYSIGSSNDFWLPYTFKNGRQQKVNILSSKQTINVKRSNGTMAFRYITTYTPYFNNGIPLNVKKQVLQYSNGKKIGAWTIVKVDNKGELLAYIAKVDANLGPEDLKQVAYWVAEIGDEMEQKLFGGDAN